MIKKKLSIVIPTRNRYKYLIECVKIINSFLDDELELVISDNSDDNTNFLDFLKTIDTSNIKYVYTKTKLSQTENSELVIEHTNGDYVCFIGDDDLVLPCISKLVDFLIDKRIDSCLFDIPKFYWPDLVDIMKGHVVLSYKTPTFETKILNTKSIFKKNLKLGFQEIGNLPRVYHGIVSKNLLEEVKKKFGSFFPGPSPDMANAVAVTYLSKKAIKTNFSPIISGYGNNSAGGMGQKKQHEGPLKGNFQLSDDIEEKWNEKIPKIWLASTIYSFSAYSTLMHIKEKNYTKKMNYGAVYLEVFRIKKYRYLIKKCNPSLIDYIRMLKYFLYKIKKRVFSKNKYINIYDSMTIYDAFILLKEINYIDDKRVLKMEDNFL